MADDRSVVPSWRLSILLVAVPCLVILGADKTWTGAGGSSNFSNGGNWSPSGTPAPGDRLVFPVATPTVGMGVNNDIPGLSVSGISFDGNASYTVTGLSMQVAGTISAGPATLWVDHYLQVPVSLVGPLTVSPTNSAAGIRFQGAISGPFPLVTGGAGWTALEAANSYGGSTTVSSGTLWARNPSALGSPSGGGCTVGSGGTLALGAALDPTMPVTLLPGGTISTTTGSSMGNVNVPGPGSATLSATSGTLAIQSLSGSGPLAVTGALTRILGSGTFSGTFSLGSPAILWVNGNYPSATGFLSLNTTLGGSGAVNDINANGGSISPGNSPGLLSATGNVTYQPAMPSAYVVELNGPAPGTGYDQLAVTGNLDLGTTTSLSATRGYDYGLGATLDIVTAGGTITGTFTSLPDNATLTIGGQTFRINYLAHSVRLTAETVVPVALQSFSVD